MKINDTMLNEYAPQMKNASQLHTITKIMGIFNPLIDINIINEEHIQLQGCMISTLSYNNLIKPKMQFRCNLKNRRNNKNLNQTQCLIPKLIYHCN